MPVFIDHVATKLHNTMLARLRERGALTPMHESVGMDDWQSYKITAQLTFNLAKIYMPTLESIP